MKINNYHKNFTYKNILQCVSIVFVFSLMGCQEQSKTAEPLVEEKKIAIALNELTIAQIHKAYKKGDYNSEQLVAAYLARIKHQDKEINAITRINSHALSIAKALDEEYKKSGELRPLHGIPIIVKDNFNTKGLATTAGALALKDFIPESDAFMVDKLVKAGAIIIAKSNMAEWAFSAMHTYSSTSGTTRNPYNLEHVPAGSSGGTAASIAANFATIGLGTDTGNSIRGPSSHNALVGFRSTLGLTSRSGIVPLYLRNDVAGPMSRTVEDATRVLEIIAGYDPKDPITKHSMGKMSLNYQQYLQKDGLKGARIGILRELITSDTDAEISALFEQAIKDMESLGAVIIDPVDIPDFSTLRENQWCSDFRKDIESYLATYVKKDNMKTLEDIIAVGTTSKYAQESLQYFTTNSGREKHPEIECGDPYTDVKRIAFRNAISTVMNDKNLDAIAYPSWNNKPATIAAFEAQYKGDNNQVIAPHTGQPAFTLPMGYVSGNLPVGLQLLGRMFDEATLIKLSYSYEQGTKHRKVPILK